MPPTCCLPLLFHSTAQLKRIVAQAPKHSHSGVNEGDSVCISYYVPFKYCYLLILVNYWFGAIALCIFASKCMYANVIGCCMIPIER